MAKNAETIEKPRKFVSEDAVRRSLAESSLEGLADDGLIRYMVWYYNSDQFIQGFHTDIEPLPLSVDRPSIQQHYQLPIIEPDKDNLIKVSSVDIIFTGGEEYYDGIDQDIGIPNELKNTRTGYSLGIVRGAVTYFTAVNLGLVTKPDVLVGCTHASMARVGKKFGFKSLYEQLRIRANIVGEPTPKEVEQFLSAQNNILGPDDYDIVLTALRLASVSTDSKRDYYDDLAKDMLRKIEARILEDSTDELYDVYGLYDEVLRKVTEYGLAHQGSLLKRASRAAQAAIGSQLSED